MAHQPIDSHEVFALKPSFASLFLISRRSEPSCFATTCWYHEIRLRRGLETVAQVSRWFHGEESGKTAFRHSQWTGRSRGTHRPSLDLVRKVDVRCPGSASLVLHPFWLCLMPALELTDLASAVAQTLSFTDAAAFRFAANSLDRQRRAGTRGKRRLYRIRQWSYDLRTRVSLDTLACQIHLLRSALQQGLIALANMFAHDVHVGLLALTPWLYQHRVQWPLVSLIYKEFLEGIPRVLETVSLCDYARQIKTLGDRADADGNNPVSESDASEWAAMVVRLFEEWRWENRVWESDELRS